MSVSDRMQLADSLRLRAVLRSLTLDRLKEIAGFWGLEPPEASEMDRFDLVTITADFLYPRLMSGQYFQPTLDKLSIADREAIYFLAMHGGEMASGELADRAFRGNTANLDKTLTKLANRGFVFIGVDAPEGLPVGEAWVSLPDAYRKLIDMPHHWTGFLGCILKSMDEGQVRVVADRLFADDLEESSLPTLRYRIRKHLLTPELLKEHVNSLSDLEKELLGEVIDRKGFCLYRDLLDASSARKFDHNRAEQINALIYTSGVVYVTSEGHNKYGNTLMVPRDILYIITRKYVPDQRTLQRIDSTGTSRREIRPTDTVENGKGLLRDLVILAGRIDSLRIKRLSTGGISRTDIKKAWSVFPSSKTPKYALFLASFLVQSGMLVEVNGEWRVSENLMQIIGEPDTLYQVLYRWWLTTSEWNELYADGIPMAGEKPPQLWGDVVHIRQQVLEAISSGSREKWVTFQTFWDSVAQHFENNLTKGSGGGGYGGVLSLRDTAAAILQESSLWLGVTSVGSLGDNTNSTLRRRAKGNRVEQLSQTEKNFVFQLTPFGKSVAQSHLSDLKRNTNEVEWNSNGQISHGARWIIIQPNLEIAAPPDLSLDAIFNLSRFCDIKNVDVMTTFELSRESLTAAMERGADGSHLLQFLKELSRTELPATVIQLIEECSVKHGEVRLGASGGYIVSDEAIVIEGLRRSPRLSPYIKEQIGEKALILADKTDVGKVARELRSMGYLPQMETGTVYQTKEGKFHLSLTAMEMQDLVAAARFVSFVESALDADISDGRAATLAQRLEPDSTGYFSVEHGAETRTKSFQKRFEGALAKLTDEISGRYKNQVSRLVFRSLSSRGQSKYHYKGANPAVERDDIELMLEFAHDHELEVELLYVKQNDQEMQLVVSPRSVEGEKLYAHNPATDSDAMYSISRILRATLQ